MEIQVSRSRKHVNGRQINECEVTVWLHAPTQLTWNYHPGMTAGLDIKDCPTALDNRKYLSDNWNSYPTCPTGQVKFEPSFMLKAVVGTENPVNEFQTKKLGRWIFSSDKWKLHSLVRQDKPQNKLMSNPGLAVYRYPSSKLPGWLPDVEISTIGS